MHEIDALTALLAPVKALGPWGEAVFGLVAGFGFGLVFFEMLRASTRALIGHRPVAVLGFGVLRLTLVVAGFGILALIGWPALVAGAVGVTFARIVLVRRSGRDA